MQTRQVICEESIINLMKIRFKEMINMKIKQNILLSFILLVSVILVLSGCMATTIKDVKNSDLIGKKVTVSGTVQNTIKIGELSGYTLKDETDTISVSSESLPEEETKITVSGTLMKTPLLGYYIEVNS